MKALLLLLLACAAPAPTGEWLIVGPASIDFDLVERYVAAAEQVTGGGLLLKGGQISFTSTLPPHQSGASGEGWVTVLYDPARGFGPPLATTALAHELCHLGLNTLDDGRAGACALLVEQAVLQSKL